MFTRTWWLIQLHVRTRSFNITFQHLQNTNAFNATQKVNDTTLVNVTPTCI